jgi:hypothetical protein
LEKSENRPNRTRREAGHLWITRTSENHPTTRLGCAFGQDNSHDSHIQVNQGGIVTFACKQCDQSQQVKHKNSQEAFLQFLWGPEAMITAINKRFVQCANGRIMDVKSHQEFKASRVDCVSQGTAVHGRAREMERRDWSVVGIVQSSEMHASRV